MGCHGMWALWRLPSDPKNISYWHPFPRAQNGCFPPGRSTWGTWRPKFDIQWYSIDFRSQCISIKPRFLLFMDFPIIYPHHNILFIDFPVSQSISYPHYKIIFMEFSLIYVYIYILYIYMYIYICIYIYISSRPPWSSSNFTGINSINALSLSIYIYIDTFIYMTIFCTISAIRIPIFDAKMSTGNRLPPPRRAVEPQCEAMREIPVGWFFGGIFIGKIWLLKK